MTPTILVAATAVWLTFGPRLCNPALVPQSFLTPPEPTRDVQVRTTAQVIEAEYTWGGSAIIAAKQRAFLST
jgi:hypothetical protein